MRSAGRHMATVPNPIASVLVLLQHCMNDFFSFFMQYMKLQHTKSQMNEKIQFTIRQPTPYPRCITYYWELCYFYQPRSFSPRPTMITLGNPLHTPNTRH